MNRRKFLGGVAATALIAPNVAFAQMAKQAAANAPAKKGVMLMNRIGPSSSELFIANADGSGEKKFLQNSVFDYHASYAPDGKSVVFTSERGGLGNSDVFIAKADGTGIEPLVTGSSVDNAPVMSPDASKVAFVSTREGYRTNIWVLDLKSKKLSNLTGAAGVQGDPSLPDGFFRPSWSPDSKWLAFSSDRNTDWRGHDEGRGWEHTQELSIYIIGVDGKGFRRVASKPGYGLGSPKWSHDGKRIVFYEITTELTWYARRPEGTGKAISQIVSVDVATGARTEHTTGPWLKVYPQYLSATEIAYAIKGGPNEGIAFTSERSPVKMAGLRAPSWSPDGKTVIYEKLRFREWKQNQQLYSWDKDWEYRYTDVFPGLSNDGTLLITEKDLNGSIAIMNPDGSNRKRIYDADSANLPPQFARTGLNGAYGPAWSPDSQWVVFGVGTWFQERVHFKATVMRVKRDGTALEPLTDGTVNSGFPSYSADGKEVVYRVWGENNLGLRVINVDTKQVRTLTTEMDNSPAWSPDGKRIMFTRRVDAVNFDVYTIKPDGSDIQRLTTNRGNDGHAVWTQDGKILWNSSVYGFRDEVVVQDNTFQPYGQIWIMNGDGSDKRILTDSLWEDSMPLYIPAKK